MKRLLVPAVLISLHLFVDVSVSAEWAKTYGGTDTDGARCIEQTGDGGYVVAGYTSSSAAGENDLWLLKLDNNGDAAWQKTYGDSGNDYPVCIQQTTEGGYIVAATTYSYGAGESDIWVLKLDSEGDILWEKTFGASGNDYAAFIQQTSEGGYILVGNTSSFGVGDSDIWLIKLTTEGYIAMQKTYGGTGFDWAFCIRQTSDLGYIIAGETFSFGAGRNDVWLLKLDWKGDIGWQKSYGGGEFDWPSCVQVTTGGGYIVAASTLSFGAGEDDIWVLLLDSEGDISWQKTYGADGFDWPRCAQETTDGGYVVAGGTYSFGGGEDDLWLLKLNSSGEVSWQKAYGGTDSDCANWLRQTADGGYVLAGTTASFGAGEDDLWAVKLDASGGIGALSVTDTNVVAQDSNCQVGSTSAGITNTRFRPQRASTGPCVVELEDYARFAKHWLDGGSGLRGDLDGDLDVDFADLKLFVDEWLHSCPYGWQLK